MKRVIVLLVFFTLILGSCKTAKEGCPKPKYRKFTADNPKPGNNLARVVKIYKNTVYLRYSYRWWMKKYDKIPDSIKIGHLVQTKYYTRVK